jgi:hypothetical protein
MICTDDDGSLCGAIVEIDFDTIEGEQDRTYIKCLMQINR